MRLFKSLPTPAKILVGVFLSFVALTKLTEWRLRSGVTQCEGVTIVVDSLTTATCAKLSSNASELRALREAADKLGGTPVAGVKVVIRVDTLYLPPTERPTDTLPNGTRVATLTDSTQDYRVEVKAEAPPAPANLRIGVRVTPVEREAEVGFVKTAGGYLAVVSGRGIRSTEAFFAPERPRAWNVLAFGEVASPLVVAPSSWPAIGVGVAAQYRAPKWQGQLEAGVRGVPFVGLRLSHAIF